MLVFGVMRCAKGQRVREAPPKPYSYRLSSSQHSTTAELRSRQGSSPQLLQVDRLVMPGLVELCTPHFVHTLVLGTAEGHGRPEPNVEVANIFESAYQSFGVELRAIALQGCDQHVGVHVAFKRHVIRLLSREVFGERRFIIEDQ